MKSITTTFAVGLFVIGLITVSCAFGQSKTGSHNMPGMSQDEMSKRGDKVMGFDHTKTTHHFLLSRDGGAIEVNANAADDKASRDEIRNHLSHIATMFAEGNFNATIKIRPEFR